MHFRGEFNKQFDDCWSIPFENSNFISYYLVSQPRYAIKTIIIKSSNTLIKYHKDIEKTDQRTINFYQNGYKKQCSNSKNQVIKP